VDVVAQMGYVVTQIRYVVAQLGGCGGSDGVCGGSVDEDVGAQIRGLLWLTWIRPLGDTRVQTQQFRVRFRLPSQSPEIDHEIRLCNQKIVGGRRPCHRYIRMFNLLFNCIQ
jgi:hypothetical protein